MTGLTDLFFGTKARKAAPAGGPSANTKGMMMLDDTGVDDVKQGTVVPETISGPKAIKKLRWLITTPPLVPYVRFEVSPDVAAEALSYLPPEDGPWQQRPLRPATVERYATDMDEGRWRETKVPVIFTKSQYLGDGQHRMRAILATGITVPFWMAFGDDDENFFVYDNNATRGAGDIFAIKGVPNHSLIAAAVKWVAAYEAGSLHTGGRQAMERGVGTPEQTYEFYCRHPGIQDSARIGHAAASTRMPIPSLMVALHYIAAHKSRAMADDFFMKLATGLGFSGKREPAYKLREYLTKTTVTPRELAVLTVDAWNATRSRKPFKTRVQDTDGHFPRMI